MHKLELLRRDALKGLLAISSAGALAACQKAGVDPENPKAISTEYAEPGKFLSGDEMALVAALADTIIPDTDTPGAIAAGVPDTLQELISGWGDDKIRWYWREGLSGLSEELGSAGQGFAELSKANKVNILGKFDAAAYKDGADAEFYKDLKRIVAGAYYMSEIGATEELIYDPVPGDFKGCVPFDEIGKAWAT